MRKLFTPLLAVALLLSARQAVAQTVVINTGTAGTPISSVGPIMLTNLGTFKASRYSYLYTQAELAAAGIPSGATITSVGWIKNSAAPTNGGPAKFRIFMKNSAATAYAAATETWANLNAGTTMVYENLTQVIPGTMNPNYVDFTLNSSFAYNGGALEISTEWDAGAVTGNPGTGELLWMWSTVPDRIYGACSTTLAPLLTLSSTTSNTAITDRRPFIQITYTSGTSAPSCVTVPTAPTNNGTACSGSTTLSWPSVPGATGYDVYLDAGATANTLVSANQSGSSYTTVIGTGPYSWRVVPQNANGSATGCATFSFNGTSAPTPSVSIAANPSNSICTGTPVTFTATPVDGGATPTYQWKKNNANVGTNSPTYTDNSLTNTDVISVEMTSNAPCASTTPVPSGSITMSVGAPSSPSVSILANPQGGVCAGTPVTFTATPTNAGATPSYQWKVNGSNVGTNSTSYTSSALLMGDLVTVEITSNAACATPPTATSNPISMAVSPPVVPSVSVTAAPGTSVPAGQMVTFTANVINGGSAPVYQWKKNGTNVGTNSNVYATNILANNDQITVTLQSNATCANPSSAASNPLTITITTTSVASVTGQLSGITIYPNPSSGTIRVKGTLEQLIPGEEVKVELQSLLGQVVYSEKLAVSGKEFEREVELPQTANGVYLLQLQYGDKKSEHRLTIAR